MTNYTKATNFAAKDSLASGNAAKVVKGTEIDTEFTNIETAVNSKSDSANPVFTGVAEFADGSASAPSITNTADTNTGVFFPAADTVGITTGGTEMVRFDSSGNLLVGTTSNPSTSSTAQAFRIGPVTTGVQMILSGTETGSYAKISFNNGNGQVGTIQTSGSATSYNTSSDYRLKENIAPMTGALAKVAQLKPVTYTWKVDGSAGEGFIAHELQEVVSGCVSGEKDAVDADGNPIYQGIDTSFLVATLTAAIQEQQAIITQLQADVAALKGQA